MRWASCNATMFETLDAAGPQLPDDWPYYLLCGGKPDEIVGMKLRGIDMFVCVLPLRSGRNGQAFAWDGTPSIKTLAMPRMPRRSTRVAV